MLGVRRSEGNGTRCLDPLRWRRNREGRRHWEELRTRRWPDRESDVARLVVGGNASGELISRQPGGRHYSPQRLLTGRGTIPGVPDRIPVDSPFIYEVMVRSCPGHRFSNEALDKNATRVGNFQFAPDGLEGLVPTSKRYIGHGIHGGGGVKPTSDD